MKTCPICDMRFEDVLLESNLPAHQCPGCYGIWISSSEYFVWRGEDQILTIDDIDIKTTLPEPMLDTNKALLCPDCGRFLRRFKILPDVLFHLDRCSGCQGIWFDQDEWDLLKLQDLHLNVHLFFTDVWQQKLRTEEMRRRFEKMYLEKFGTEDYQKIKEIRAWITAHPLWGNLLTYLTDKEPYKA